MIADLLAWTTSVLRAAGPWLGPALALAAFIEALLIVGLFVPLTPLMVASGAAMGAGMIGSELLPWIMAGSFAGSTACYELGRQWKRRTKAQPRLPEKARALTEQLFVQHGPLAIVIARFIGPPATVAPFLAGWTGLARSRFLAAAALSSLIWPPSMVAIGFMAAWLPTH